MSAIRSKCMLFNPLQRFLRLPVGPRPAFLNCSAFLGGDYGTKENQQYVRRYRVLDDDACLGNRLQSAGTEPGIVPRSGNTSVRAAATEGGWRTAWAAG